MLESDDATLIGLGEHEGYALIVVRARDAPGAQVEEDVARSLHTRAVGAGLAPDDSPALLAIRYPGGSTLYCAVCPPGWPSVEPSEMQAVVSGVVRAALAAHAGGDALQPDVADVLRRA